MAFRAGAQPAAPLPWMGGGLAPRRRLPALGHEQLKYLSLFGVVGDLLRMPLHGHQEGIIVRRFHRFDQPVFRVGRDLKSVSETLDGLVMQAVYPASALKDPRQPRIGIGERHGMRGLGAAP